MLTSRYCNLVWVPTNHHLVSSSPASASSTSSPLSPSSILNNCVVQQQQFGGSKHFSGAHYLWEQQQQRNSNLSNNSSSAAPFQCSFVRVRTVNVVRPLNPYVVYWTTTSPAPSPSHLFSPITMETRYIFKTMLLCPPLMYFQLINGFISVYLKWLKVFLCNF